MLNNRKDKMRSLKRLIICSFILIFIGLITSSRALAQWPPYSESFFNPTFSFLNSPYTNFFTSSLFPPFGSRGLESYGNYVNREINNSYTYGNFGNFSPSIFSSFPGTALGGLYGGPNGGLYAGLTNYNTFSSGLFSPLIPNTYMTPLSLGPWANSSPWQGLTVTANNSWPGLPSVVTPYNPFDPFPSPNPYVQNTSSNKTINIETEEYLVYSALIEEKFSSDSAILKQAGFKGENPYYLLNREYMEGLEKETVDNYTVKNAKQYTLEDKFTLEGDYELIDDKDASWDSWDLAFSRVGFNSEKNQALVHVAKNFSTTFYFLIKEDGVWKVESGYMDTVM